MIKLQLLTFINIFFYLFIIIISFCHCINAKNIVLNEYLFQKNNAWLKDQLSIVENTEIIKATCSQNIFIDNCQTCLHYILFYPIRGTEDHARKIEVLKLAKKDIRNSLEIILTNQNSDGGWGYDIDYQSNEYHSAFALSAINVARISDPGVIAKTIKYISARQNDNGSFSLVDNNESIYLTSLIVLSLKPYQSASSAIDQATQWIMTQQNSDGGFGKPGSSFFESTYACRVLYDSNASNTDYRNALNYIIQHQQPNGSFNNNIYDTAIAIQALQQATIEVNLYPGLNIYGFWLDVEDGYTSYDMINEIGSSDEIDMIQKYDPIHGKLLKTYYTGTLIQGDEFPINGGEGFLVYMKQEVTATQLGRFVQKSFSLYPGLNIVAIPVLTTVSSFDLIQSLGYPDEISSIQRFDRKSGQFQTTTYLRRKPAGVNFPINHQEALLIYMRVAKDIEFPFVPSSNEYVLKDNNVKESEQSSNTITGESPDQYMVITDVSTRSFSVAWITETPGKPGLNIFKDENGHELVSEAQIIAFPATTPLNYSPTLSSTQGKMKVTAKGLEPDTLYYFQLLTFSSDGFTTAKPEYAPFYHVRTESNNIRTTVVDRKEVPFANDLIVFNLNQEKTNLSDPDNITLLLAYIEGSAYTLSNFVGNGVYSPEAYVDLNNLFYAYTPVNMPTSGGEQLTLSTLKGMIHPNEAYFLPMNDQLAEMKSLYVSIPVANAGDDRLLTERDAFQGKWKVKFNGDASTDDVRIIRYEWNFGDNQAGIGMKPFHEYSPVSFPATYDVQLTVTNNSAQSAIDDLQLTIDLSGCQPPVADPGLPILADEIPDNGGEWVVNFDASGSSDDYQIYTYEWDWDYDGITFKPSGDMGVFSTHTFIGEGTHVVALRVTDHALQSNIATVNVTLERIPPIAEAGDDQIIEGHWPLRFNGSKSTDDVGIARYEWNFGDGSLGDGLTPTHIYWNHGEYVVALTAYDNMGLSNTDTMNVSVITGTPPVANAGGPYNAAKEGPPAYFDGIQSSDDYGVVKYLWDVDSSMDSDGDGNFTNDLDVVGARPFYTYTETGSYTVTLTVIDGAEQSHAITTTVNVVDNLPPHVICVPWRDHDETIPHETYNGNTVRLKAIVRDAGDLTYQWDFGDGSEPFPITPAFASVSNKYCIEASHVYPDSPDGTPYVATLTVWDRHNQKGADQYYVTVFPDDLDTKSNIAVDEALWALFKAQDKTYGKWYTEITGNYYGYGSYLAAPTASAVKAFEINGHTLNGNTISNPYIEAIITGFEYLFKTLNPVDIGESDNYSNKNQIGLEANASGCKYFPVYETGFVMDAIACSHTPLAFATTGGEHVLGRFYYQILTDMVDMYVWGQTDEDHGKGGWGYKWNGVDILGPNYADLSASQWAAIGILSAEKNFGIQCPKFIKNKTNFWLDRMFDNNSFYYRNSNDANSYPATKPAGLIMLAFSEQSTSDDRWRSTEQDLDNRWDWFTSKSRSIYTLYTIVKGLRLAHPKPVVNLSSTGVNWFDHPSKGIKQLLINEQNILNEQWGTWESKFQRICGPVLDTSFAVGIFSSTLFAQSPVANSGEDIIWSFNEPITLDASKSYHIDPVRRIIRYEWDINGDGIWDVETTNPVIQYTYAENIDGHCNELQTQFIAKLRVTDDNDPEQTDVDSKEIILTDCSHMPFAVMDVSERGSIGIPLRLNGSKSYDLDPDDAISRYQWDLDNDGQWFDDTDIDSNFADADFTYYSEGAYAIALQVFDRGAYNPVDCQLNVNCIPMKSKPVYKTVEITENHSPIANAGGSYEIEIEKTLTLDASKSSDPDTNPLYFSWDLDNDGQYDDASSVKPEYTWYTIGTYQVGVQVSDTKLTDTVAATVNVVEKIVDPASKKQEKCKDCGGGGGGCFISTILY
jgi:PKD repeat protein/prenyltransferase beta subunit